jgi:hypothetical protein
MALIKCPECSAEISDQASACPKCGKPLIPPAPSASSTELDNALKQEIANNRKIAAIKLLREKTGIGLKEAKDYVEDLEKGLHPKLPGSTPAPAPGQRPKAAQGCTSVLVCAVLFVAGITAALMHWS